MVVLLSVTATLAFLGALAIGFSVENNSARWAILLWFGALSAGLFLAAIWIQAGEPSLCNLRLGSDLRAAASDF